MRRAVRAFALALVLATAGRAGAEEARDAAAQLSRLEAALAAEPDSLPLANDYRRRVIRAGEHDRALAFFEKLVADHPQAANAWLNFGYAHVDKIPSAGSITQVILANSAITQFSRSLELKRSWLALYTRGNAYLYWPKIFGRAPLAVADLEEAVSLSRKEAPRPHHVRAFIALGDAYWKTDQPDKARAAWQEGLRLFPKNPQLESRLAREGETLETFLTEQRDPAVRVDTDLSLLWEPS